MSFAERIADETSRHYAELRQRGVPAALAWLMAWWFHHTLTRTVLLDDAFDAVVERMLAPAKEA